MRSRTDCSRKGSQFRRSATSCLLCVPIGLGNAQSNAALSSIACKAALRGSHASLSAEAALLMPLPSDRAYARAPAQ